jgi:uncharacterized protein (TIGR03437 family)
VPSVVANAIIAKSTPNKVITSNPAGTTKSILFTDHLNTISPLALTVNAASLKWIRLAPDSRVSAFGNNLATTTVIASGAPPTSLGGTTVKVKDEMGTERFAPIIFVSPNQVNYIIPTGTSAYGNALVTITNSNQASSFGAIQASNIGPGSFAANANGSGVASGYVLRIKANGTQSYEPIAQWSPAFNQYISVPIDLGPLGDQVYLIQYATGFRYRSSLSAVTATVGFLNTPVTYAGPEGTIGLDQINLGPIPRSLIGAGVVNVTTKADGKTANIVLMQIQ